MIAMRQEIRNALLSKQFLFSFVLLFLCFLGYSGLKRTPIPSGVVYEPAVKELEALPIRLDISSVVYGEMPIMSIPSSISRLICCSSSRSEGFSRFPFGVGSVGVNLQAYTYFVFPNVIVFTTENGVGSRKGCGLLALIVYDFQFHKSLLRLWP